MFKATRNKKGNISILKKKKNVCFWLKEGMRNGNTFLLREKK